MLLLMSTLVMQLNALGAKLVRAVIHLMETVNSAVLHFVAKLAMCLVERELTVRILMFAWEHPEHAVMEPVASMRSHKQRVLMFGIREGIALEPPHQTVNLQLMERV